jgi:DNA mismatch repair ATPase MutL
MPLWFVIVTTGFRGAGLISLSSVAAALKLFSSSL